MMLREWKPCHAPLLLPRFAECSYVSRASLKVSSVTSHLLNNHEQSNTEKISIEQVR
jgi:hypothetical protein